MSTSHLRLVLACAISVVGLATLAIVQAQQPAAELTIRLYGHHDCSRCQRSVRRAAPLRTWRTIRLAQPYQGPAALRGGRPHANPERGQPVKELGIGEADYTAPRSEHWHGAAAETHLIQINVGFGGEHAGCKRRLRMNTTERNNGA